MNSKLHAVTDALGRSLRMFLTAGQRSDYIGALALLDGLPPAKHMLADRGYDTDWYTASPASRTGGVSHPATTNARRSSCLHVPWPQWSCSGYES